VVTETFSVGHQSYHNGRRRPSRRSPIHDVFRCSSRAYNIVLYSEFVTTFRWNESWTSLPINSEPTNMHRVSPPPTQMTTHLAHAHKAVGCTASVTYIDGYNIRYSLQRWFLCRDNLFYYRYLICIYYCI